MKQLHINTIVVISIVALPLVWYYLFSIDQYMDMPLLLFRGILNANVAPLPCMLLTAHILPP